MLFRAVAAETIESRREGLVAGNCLDVFKLDFSSNLVVRTVSSKISPRYMQMHVLGAHNLSSIALTGLARSADFH